MNKKNVFASMMTTRKNSFLSNRNPSTNN